MPCHAAFHVSIAACLALSPAVANAEGASPARDRAAPAPAPIDQEIRRHMAEGGLVGAAAAILVDGEVVWKAGFGLADRETGRPFTTDTVMNIASISKTVTGVALMRAVEHGRLSLDTDVGEILPFPVRNPHHPDQPITLRQLATHTSGLVDRWDVYAASYHFGRDAPRPLGDFLAGYLVPGGKDYARENFLDAAPGTHREYSNIGAGLAGFAVESATGRTLDAWTQEQVFRPLGMTRTRWRIDAMPMDDHATLHVAQDGIAVAIQPYAVTTWPDGGLRTSVDDLSRFFAMLLQGGTLNGTRVLERRSVEEMVRLQFTAAHAPDNVDIAEKNSGLFWQTKFDTRYVGHGGSDPGLKTEMLATPDLRAGVILFTNTAGDENATKAYIAILKALFAHAEVLRTRRSPRDAPP